MLCVDLRHGSHSLLATSLALHALLSMLTKHSHRYNHARRSEMVKMLERSGHPHQVAENLYSNIVDNFLVCKRSVETAPFRKISLIYVCEDFSNEVQTDFMYPNVRSTKYCIFYRDRGQVSPKRRLRAIVLPRPCRRYSNQFGSTEKVHSVPSQLTESSRNDQWPNL